MRSTSFRPFMERCIRFYPACRYRLITAVRKLRLGTGKCRQPRPVEVPLLGGLIAGVELTLRKHWPYRAVPSVPCLNDQRTNWINLEGLTKRRRPACWEPVGPRLVHERKENFHQQTQIAAASGPGNRKQSDSSPIPPPINAAPAGQSRKRDAPDKEPPGPLVYHSTTTPGHNTSRPSSTTIQPRAARILAYTLMHFGVPLIGFLLFFITMIVSSLIFTVDESVGTPLCCLSALMLIGSGVWLLFGFYPSWWLSRPLASLVVSSFRCPYCHQDYEAISRWTCGCGFVDHRERHIMRFFCPKCNRITGYYNCDRCDSTIIL